MESLLIVIIFTLSNNNNNSSLFLNQLVMTYLFEFANGQTVESYDNSYITVITWEQMFGSKIVKCNGQPVY